MSRLPFSHSVRLGSGETVPLTGEYDEETTQLLTQVVAATRSGWLRHLAWTADRFLRAFPDATGADFFRFIGGRRGDAYKAFNAAKERVARPGVDSDPASSARAVPGPGNAHADKADGRRDESS
jgi:hypothetical protein